MGCAASVRGQSQQAVAPADSKSRSETNAASGKLQVFCCNQHTQLFQEKFRDHIGLNANTKASMPPFNIVKDVPIPDNIMHFGMPVFGPNILNSIMAIFLSPDTTGSFHDLAVEMGINIPPYALDGFLQKKVPRVKALLDVARNRQDCAEGPNADAITKCERWVDAFQNLSGDKIANLTEWHSFVEQYVPNGWQHKLHYDLVLSNFGFEDETAKALGQHVYDDDGKPTNLQHYSLRWLAKSFSGYGPVGCLTDVANLVFAMVHDTPPSQVSESDVVACLQAFSKRVQDGDFNGIWIPDVLIVDCELDDMLSWLLVEYIYRHTKRPSLKVLVQLPTDPALNSVAEKLGALGAEVYRDDGSRNAEVVKGNFGVK